MAVSKNKDMEFLLREVCKYRKHRLRLDQNFKSEYYCGKGLNESECKCQCLESEGE